MRQGWGLANKDLSITSGPIAVLIGRGSSGCSELCLIIPELLIKPSCPKLCNTEKLKQKLQERVMYNTVAIYLLLVW